MSTPEDYLIDVAPWERQPAETEDAWLAFRTYRDLDERPRSLKAVRAHFSDQGIEKSPAMIRNWSSRWKWSARAAAYDIHMDRVRQRAKEKEAADIAARHARMAQAGLALIVQRLMGNPEKGVQRIDINEVGFRDLIAAFSALVKIERVSAGMPAERSATEVSGPGGGPVDIRPVIFAEEREDPAADRERAARVLAILAESGVVQLPEGSGEVLTIEAGDG